MELGTELFDDIVVILVAAGAGGLGARLLHLPPIIGYLVAGAVVGPHALGMVTQLEDVQTLARVRRHPAALRRRRGDIAV